MSVARDFESRPGRSNTTATLPVPLSPIGRHDTSSSHRRGSTTSHGSLRFRHPSRTQTVTAYNDHEATPNEPMWQPGAEPGIDTAAEDEQVPPEVINLKAQCEINIIDFSPIDIRHIRADNDNLAKALEDPRPDDLPCRWISVNGLSWDVIKCLGNKYNLHRLAIEDIIQEVVHHVHTRTKVDWYADHACVILTLQKLVRLHEHGSHKAGQCDFCDEESLDHHGRPRHRRWWQRKPPGRKRSELPYSLDKDGDGKIDEYINAHSGTSTDAPIRQVRTLHRYESSQIPEHTAFMESHSSLAAESLSVSVEQVSIFLLNNNTIISFFEQSADDVDKPILKRLNNTETMLRRSCDASLLLQAIIDAIVDLAVPVKDAYNKSRKELQVDALINPNIKTSRSLHIFGEEIDMLQNLFKPIVHLVNALRDHNSEPLHPLGQIPQVQLQRPTPSSSPQRHPQREDFNRKMSDFRKPAPLQRNDTATSVMITPLAHTYFGDVLDHCMQVSPSQPAPSPHAYTSTCSTMIQTLEQMDASATNISTLIFNTVGAKTNNFMMILAVVTVFFSPLTFISGYFGMNFSNGNGLDHPFAFFWTVAMPSLVVFMGIVFATMLWENIEDAASKRGIRAHRRTRNAARRAAGWF